MPHRRVRGRLAARDRVRIGSARAGRVGARRGTGRALDERSRPGVFVHTGQALALDAPGHDDIANVGFIVGARCVAVIDSGGSVRVGPRAARGGAGSARRCRSVTSSTRTCTWITCSATPPSRRMTPQFVGHAQLAAALARSREFFLKNYAADFDRHAGAEQIIGPQRTVAVGHELDLDLGGAALTLRAWPTAHTDCDLTVFDRATARCGPGICCSCGRTPALDGSLKGWLAVSRWLGAACPRSTSCPATVPCAATGRRARTQRRYLEASAAAACARELAQGKPMQEADPRGRSRREVDSGCCGTRPTRATWRAPTRNSSGSDAPASTFCAAALLAAAARDGAARALRRLRGPRAS